MYVCVCARARTRALVLAYARERPRKTEGVPSSIRPWALGDMGEEALKVPVMIQQRHTLFVRFSRFDHCTRLHGLACVVFSRVPICTKAASVRTASRPFFSQNWACTSLTKLGVKIAPGHLTTPKVHTRSVVEVQTEKQQRQRQNTSVHTLEGGRYQHTCSCCVDTQATRRPWKMDSNVKTVKFPVGPRKRVSAGETRQTTNISVQPFPGWVKISG